MKIKKVHRNVPQLVVNAINAKTTVCLWGRATGKTEGVVAMRALKNAQTMPGSVGAIICDSYIHLLSEILPEIVMTWKKIGLVEGVHFWVNKFPPNGVPKAFRQIMSADNCVFLANGSALKFYSTTTIKNGDSIDWMIVEEARFVRYVKLIEMFKCLRGNRQYFAHRAEHHSILIVTDMPKDLESEWLFEFDKQVNPERIEYILHCEQQISLRQQKIIEWQKQLANIA